MKCQRCNQENHNLATYCGKCGQKVSVEKEGDYNKPVKNISIFFFTILAYLIFLHFTRYGGNYLAVLIADSIFALIVLIFFAINYKTTKHLFRLKKYNKKIIYTLLIGAPLLALIVNFVCDFLNQSVFNQSHSIYYEQFQNSPAPLLFSIISTAVFPAIFEEIMFRGVLFNETLKIAGLKSTILITSILFTILHLSLISIFWIFPIGLVFGYLRAKYNTILYGVIGHFVYNASVVIVEIILN
jgi:membrane protease YdiL (CAAX protease family)